MGEGGLHGYRNFDRFGDIAFLPGLVFNRLLHLPGTQVGNLSFC